MSANTRSSRYPFLNRMSGPFWTLEKDRPSRHRDPLAWERSWERDFAMAHTHPKWTQGRLPDLLPKELAAIVAGDSDTLSMAHQTRHLVRLQGIFAREAAEAFAMRNFESHWRSASQESRQRAILQGICATLEDPDAEVDRPWCPDSTLTSLSSRDGEAYLDMVKALIPADLLAPLAERDPVFLPHPFLDRICTLTEEEQRQLGYRAMAYFMKLGRSRLLTEITYNILLVFYGKEPMDGRRWWKGFSSKVTADSILRELPEAVRDSEGIRSAARFMAEPEPNPRPAVHQCWTCGVREKPGTRMQACIKCREVGRRVTYCSKTCQTKDWKTGYHKKMCGKALSEGDLAELTEGIRLTEKLDEPDFMTNPCIPDAQPGYTRTPALTHQVLMLRRAKGVQYIIFRPDLFAPDPYYLVDLPAADFLESLFLICRNRAFASGDREAVKAMYVILATFPDGPDHVAASPEHIRRQLEKEFNVDLSGDVWAMGDVIKDMARPTPDEIDVLLLDREWQRLRPVDERDTVSVHGRIAA